MAKGNLSLDDRELRAAQAVRAVHGAAGWAIIPRDIAGAPAGTHDFDLSDGATTVAVEVTTIAKTATLRDSAEWDKDFPDLAVDLEGLGNGWLVWVEGTAKVREVRRQLGTWLAELERLDLLSVRTERWQEHAFTPESYRPEWFDTLHEMQAAGLVHAEVQGSLTAGECMFIRSSEGHVWDPSDYAYIADFVSDQLAGAHASDLKKLQRAGADRRVLFLWLDAQSYFDIIRLLDNGVLSGNISNAGPADEVWIGRHFKNNAISVYRWNAGEGWAAIHLQEEDLVDTKSG